MNLYPAFRAAIVLFAALGAAAPAAARAGTVRVEAEDMVAAGNLGGDDIRITTCSAASQGLAVDGLDREGEWLRVPLVLEEGGCLVDSLRSAGLLGLERTFALDVPARSVTWGRIKSLYRIR